MYKNTLPPGINSPSQFLVSRTSKFMPPDLGIPYYVGMKHLRNGEALQNLFSFLFDSEVYPILPGESEQTFRILTETSNFMVTEIGDYLVLELAP
jgi:hypothetical protein